MPKHEEKENILLLVLHSYVWHFIYNKHTCYYGYKLRYHWVSIPRFINLPTLLTRQSFIMDKFFKLMFMSLHVGYPCAYIIYIMVVSAGNPFL